MKNKKLGIRIIGLLLTAALIFVFSGCSSNNSTSSNSSSNASKTKVFTDMLGRKVTLSTNIKRIVLVRTMDIYALFNIR